MHTSLRLATLVFSATSLAAGAPPFRVNTNVSMFVFSDPDVRIFRDDFDPASPDLAGLSTRELTTLQPFDDAYVDSLSTYNALRFMDWNLTNGSERRLWSERPDPLANTRSSTEPLIDPETSQVRRRRDGTPTFDSVQGSFNVDKDFAVAYEWMVALANQANKDIWINVPHLVIENDPDYARNLAALVRDGLDADRKVYIEYSNEVWNGQFSQSQYAVEQGLRRVVGPEATGDFVLARDWFAVNEPEAVEFIDPFGAIVLRDGAAVVEAGDPVGGSAAAIWTATASVRIWEAFRDVFGEEFEDRVVTVLPSLAAAPEQTRFFLELLELDSVNPNRLRPDAFAIAPYVGLEQPLADGESYADDVDATIDTLLAEIAPDSELVISLAEDKRMLDALGIDYVAYEGGQHLVGEGSGIVNRDPRMGELYREYFETLDPYLDEFFHWYDRGFFGPPNGDDSPGGTESFGAIEFLGQPLSEAPKLRAILEWNDQAIPLHGDFNSDGVVDAADYSVWRDNLGSTDESAISFNGDGGGISESDYELWRDNFGRTSASLAVRDAPAVPEPGTVSLLGLLFSSLVSRRDRRKVVEANLRRVDHPS